MTSRGRLPAAVLVVAAAVCAASGYAVADPVTASRPPLTVSINGAHFTDRPNRSLVADGLVPGRAVTSLLGLRSGVDDATAMSLQVRPATGEQAPNALRRSTVITVAASDARGRGGSVLWTGSADRLATPTTMDVVLPPGGDAWIRVTAALPATAGNEVADRSLDFGMRIALVHAGLGVAGVEVGRGADPGEGRGTNATSTGGLSFTGVQLALLLAAAGLLIAAGALVLVSTRRVTRGRAPAPGR